MVSLGFPVHLAVAKTLVNRSVHIRMGRSHNQEVKDGYSCAIECLEVYYFQAISQYARTHARAPTQIFFQKSSVLSLVSPVLWRTLSCGQRTVKDVCTRLLYYCSMAATNNALHCLIHCCISSSHCNAAFAVSRQLLAASGIVNNACIRQSVT
jgi:hypothetical protein